MKQSKSFKFNFPLNNRVVDLTRPNGFRIDLVDELEVSGTVYHCPGSDEPYQADIDFVRWNGFDIKPILLSDLAESFYDQIHEEAIQYAEFEFTSYEIYNPLFELMVKSINEL